MPAKLYRVKLTEAERNELKALINKGRIAARKQTHARILLQCDESGENPAKKDQDVAAALNTSARSVGKGSSTFCGRGLGISPQSEGRRTQSL